MADVPQAHGNLFYPTWAEPEKKAMQAEPLKLIRPFSAIVHGISAAPAPAEADKATEN